MVFTTRLELTEQENDFYRRILYRVTSDPEFGQPYLKRAFYRLIPVSVLGTRTMAVDEHWRVYIDFTEMMNRGVDYASGIMNHEIWHLLRQHHERAETLPTAPAEYNKRMLWNIAADLEINDDISDLLPVYLIKPGRSTFKKYPSNSTLENYYDLLLDDLPNVAEDFPIEHKDRNDGSKGDDEKSSEKQDDSQSSSSSGEQDSSDSNGGESDGSEEDSSSSSSESSEKGKPDSNQPGKENSSSDDSDGESESENPSDKGQESSQDGEEGSSESSDSSDSPAGDESGSESQDGSSSGQSSGKQSSSSSEQGSGSQAGSSSGEGSSASGQSSNSSGNSSSGSSSGGKSSREEPYDFWRNPNCGSSAGNPQDYELPEDATDEMDENELDNLLNKVAADFQQFEKEMLSSGKSVGSQSGNRFSKISEWAKDRLKAKPVSWKQEFRGHFKQKYGATAGKLLYVRNRPSRRQPIPDVMFPALRSPKPTIALGIDVSGSNLPNLRLILQEVLNIMKSVGVRGKDLKAFAVDVDASKVKFVDNPLTLLDDLPVGGGTRMKPGYVKLAEIGHDISILITDGYVDDYPKEKPKGRKNTHFITCIVAAERDSDLETRLEKAKKYVGEWSTVLPLIALDK